MLDVREIRNGRVVESRREPLGPELPYTRAARMSALGIQVLICGAISMEYAGLIEMYGIRIIPFVTGEIQRVLEAYLQGNLSGAPYQMPGFRGGRRYRHQGGRGRGGRGR